MSFALQVLVVPILRSRAVLDVPGERSSHVVATPRGGGVAVVLALIAVLAAMVQPPLAIVASVAGFAALGAIDDVRSLPAIARLIVQVVLAGLTSAAVISVLDLPSTVIVGFVGCMAWLVLYVNGFNFMDGINGISAMQAVLMGVAFGVCGLILDSGLLTGGGAALAGAAAGFLPFNARPAAKVFLGDVGSYGLGAAIALLAVLAVAEGVPVWVALAIPGIYLADVLGTLARRALERKPLLSAHRDHVYQHLIRTGSAHLPVAFFVSTASAVAASCAITAWAADPSPVRVAAVLGIGVVIVGYLMAASLFRRLRIGRLGWVSRQAGAE